MLFVEGDDGDEGHIRHLVHRKDAVIEGRFRLNKRYAPAADGQDPERVQRETDPESLSEGLYVKWEEGGVVRGRYKFIRTSFPQAVVASGSHWQDRPILPNQLAPGVDLFGAGS